MRRPVSETYYLGAYWGPRKESAEECARRAQAFFKGLEQADPLFSRWFKAAKSRKQMLQRPLELDLPALQKYLQSKVLRDDLRMPMEDVGFSVGLWNGGSGGDDVGLSLVCGGYSQWTPNFCVLRPPSSGPHAERLLTGPLLVEVLRCMARAWDPDSGVAMSHAYRELAEEQGRQDVQVGWVTYLSRRQGTVPPLPDPVRVEPVEDRGTLILLTPERFTASNPEHVALADRVRATLEHAGLLQERSSHGS